MESLAKNEDLDYEVEETSVSNRRLFGFLFQVLFYGTVVGNISILVPLYALEINGNAMQVGMIAGCRGFGHFLLVVPVGIMIDRFGIKKVFTISSFFSFFIVLMIPLATNPNILLLFAVAEGMACSTRLTSINAWAFDLLPYLKPSQIGWYKGMSNAGSTILGPIIGSFISESFGFVVAFTVVAIATLAANLIEVFFGTSTGPKEGNKENRENVLLACINLLKMFRNPKLLFAAYGESLNSAFSSCFRILIILLIVSVMHKSSGIVSVMTSLVGGAYLTMVFLGGAILKHLKSKTMYILSGVIVAIALLIMTTNQNIIFIGSASILAGLGLGILSIVNYRTIGSIKGASGKVSGIITFSTGVTLCMAPMIITCIVEMSSFKEGFLTLSIPFIFVIILVSLKDRIKAKLKIV